MIELMILYVLSQAPSTMYGVLKIILRKFSPFTKPSFGTIKPALLRLENNGLLSSRKIMSDGGKPSVIYSISDKGLKELRDKILGVNVQNPVQFISNSRIQISCSDFLACDDRLELFDVIKKKAVYIKTDAEKKIEHDSPHLNFYHRMILDNTICEYGNFINLIEGLERGSNN